MRYARARAGLRRGPRARLQHLGLSGEWLTGLRGASRGFCRMRGGSGVRTDLIGVCCYVLVEDDV